MESQQIFRQIWMRNAGRIVSEMCSMHGYYAQLPNLAEEL